VAFFIDKQYNDMKLSFCYLFIFISVFFKKGSKDNAKTYALLDIYLFEKCRPRAGE